LAQHPLRHEAEHLTHVAAGQSPAQRGERGLRDRATHLLGGLEQAADDLQVGVDETVAVEHGDAGIAAGGAPHTSAMRGTISAAMAS